ncbi:TPA: hypothetical protein N2Y25_004363 [Escherichia coli]|uniref:Type IV secretion system protein n=1 Tax=Salmonella enterica TaxID=28901 RepID=A0A5Y7V0A1_SALER|nr:hypothetical protein [Escherichia coli]EAN4497384.1 hypothetical protein [Salmonella enterica]ECQ2987562.1 hypothetical protein [Salmonella enterica]EIE8896684.1 hypothetical protein [Salmonella enterica]HCL7711892.1 hypothetical protein [Escherichia coli]HDV4719704.1 hypothetical protein [Escherichia coli]
MKRTLLAVIMAGILSSPVYAGVPVDDFTQIAGQLRELSQGIRDYEEYIKQTALSNTQLLEAYKRYDQMLADYQQVLREAERLKTTLQGVDLQNFLNNLKNIDLYDPRYASGDDPNVGSKPWDDAVERNKLLNGWGMSDQEWSEMNAAIPYTGDDRERAKAIFQYRKRKAEMSIQQDVASDNFATNIASQAKEAQKTKDALDALGDNDSLATQQLIARQQQLLIEQNLNQQAQTNTDFKMSNQVANDYFNKMARARALKEKAMADAYKGDN